METRWLLFNWVMVWDDRCAALASSPFFYFVLDQQNPKFVITDRHGFLLLKIKSPKVLITLQSIFYHNASEITTEYEQIPQKQQLWCRF